MKIGDKGARRNGTHAHRKAPKPVKIKVHDKIDGAVALNLKRFGMSCREIGAAMAKGQRRSVVYQAPAVAMAIRNYLASAR